MLASLSRDASFFLPRRRPDPRRRGSRRRPALIEDKVVEADALASALARLPRPWVFTNGVFDVLHRGHVSYLQAARLLGAHSSWG
jgi:hypothetical protein